MKNFKFIGNSIFILSILSVFSYIYVFKTEYSTIIDSAMNTILLSGFIVVFSTIIGSYLAYSLYFYKIKYKKTLVMLLIFPFIIPSYIVSMLYLEYSSILVSDMGYVFIMTLVSIPYTFMFVYLGLTNIKQKEILVLEKFNISKKDVLVKIIGHYIKRPILISSFLIFAISFTEFGTAIFTGANVLIIKVYELWFTSYDVEKALNVIIFSYLVFFILLFVIFIKKQKNISISYLNKDNEKLLTYRGIYTNKRYILIFWIVITIVVLLQTVIPIFILGKWTYLSYDFFNIIDLSKVIYNTLYIVCFAVIMILITTMMLIRFYSEKNIMIYSFLHTNYFIPSLFLGFVGLYMIEIFELSMSMTFVVLLMVLTIKYIPISLSLFNEKLQTLNKRTLLISYMFNKSKIWTIKKIIAPHLFLSIVLSFFVLTLQIIKELPITLLLRPLEMDTLAVKAYYYSSAEMLYISGIWIMLLIIVVLSISSIIYLLKTKIKGG